MIAKRALCHEQQVPHYLVIDPDARTVEQVTGEGTCIHPVNGRLELELTGQANCKISIESSRLFD